MRHQTTRSLLLAALLAAGIGQAAAQTVNWNPRTGDVWVDNWLGDMNRYGTRYREPFVNEMVRYYDVPRPYVTDLLGRNGWSPGDVYYACAIAQVINRPCNYVADQYDANRGQGWGVLAQRMGIKPGSAEFHRLKKGFVPTYDRWGRPIDLDADLQRAYPNRGKPANVGKGGGKSTGKPVAHGKSGDHTTHGMGHGTGAGKGPKSDKGAKGGKSGNGGNGNKGGKGHH